MKKPVCLLLSVLIFLSGCAGRTANPIAAYLPGDETRSCEGLKAEIAQLQVDMARILPKTDKGLTNALWALGGCVVIVPFFFMDLKDAEKIEFEAMRTRHNRLLLICLISFHCLLRLLSTSHQSRARNSRTTTQPASSQMVRITSPIINKGRGSFSRGTLTIVVAFQET